MITSKDMVKESDKRLLKNTLLLYFRMLFMMLINLYASRLILEKLGVEDYGIYNIIGGVVALFTFISGAMTASTQRFLNHYLGLKDFVGLNKAFNASQIIHIAISLSVLILAETIGLWFLYNKLVIPVERFDAAFWTYQCSIVSTCIIIISYPYNATIIANEKMGAFAYVSILEGILKFAIIFLLDQSKYDKLVLYAILLMCIQLIITSTYRIYCIKHFPETHFNITQIPKRLYKEILSFSGWNLLGNIANIALIQGTNILLNLFFGPTVNAAKGISVQVQNTVGAFCSNFQVAQNPQIMKTFSSGKLNEMHSLVCRTSRFSFYLMLIFSVPIIMKTDDILTLWLKTPPEYTSIFVQYTMFFNLIQSLANPLLTSSLATGNVKKIMLYIAILFWLIIPVGYIMLKLGGNPIIIFQIQLSLYILAHIIRIYIVCHQIKLSIKTYLLDVIIPIIKVTPIAFIIGYILSTPFGNNFLSLAIYAIVCIFIIIGIIYTLGIKTEEKETIINYLRMKFHLS